MRWQPSIPTSLLGSALLITLTAVAAADPVPGDTYFIAPGAGMVKGFQLAGGPFELSSIDGESEIIGMDITGQGVVSSSDELIQNTATNFDFTLRVETTGNFLPSGIIGNSGGELTTLGLFVGGGVDAVDFTQPVFANTAVIEVFDTSESSLGTIDVIDLSNFQTGIGGGWDGSLGLNFSDLIPIGDVGAIELQINYDTAAIPEPAAGGACALLSLVLFSRRRKSS